MLNKFFGKFFWKFFFLFVFNLVFAFKGWSQSGCTDPKASNYDSNATTNNCQCNYAPASEPLTNPRRLPASLNENSGLFYTNGQLWTINDSGWSNEIYRIDETNGAILQTVTLEGATNVDWEAITGDENFIYVGDFGNNDGTRTNLKIYRINKSDLQSTTASVVVETIYFKYEDQNSTSPTGNNNTDFDCEAFLVKDNKIHLFTKQWISQNTSHYVLAANPGADLQTAVKVETIQVGGLITDAVISPNAPNYIALISYPNLYRSTQSTNLFMWLLYDLKGENLESCNTRQVSLGSAFGGGQIEGLALKNNETGYIGSERINELLIKTEPQLYDFNIAAYIPTPQTLPVEMVNYKVTQNRTNVTLSWTTVSEVNSEKFTVERSEDGVTYYSIKELKAAGHSSQPINYKTTDQLPIIGVNYYRIKQTDLDGSFTYSAVKAVEILGREPVLEVSPVPVKQGQLLQVRLRNSNPANSTITLTGTDGKIYYNKLIDKPGGVYEQFSVGHLSKGIYILRCTTALDTYTSKIIIQ
ncbi:T9SS type A sorting domain-containing protein [Adhaeribacter aquaticus]|uniref:T9SS type A sorting domain-containing protein n=1 Tax=Adhaeribacter aquaticus TaxID=299567 RepID=UPI00040B96E9|nr:T9SS type A sorting domain-containing protein [Adhaeribacter aquaticus]